LHHLAWWNKNHEKEKMENMKTKQAAHKPHIVPPIFFQPFVVIPLCLLQQWNNNNMRTKKENKNSHSSIHFPFNLLHLLHLTWFNNIKRTKWNQHEHKIRSTRTSHSSIHFHFHLLHMFHYSLFKKWNKSEKTKLLVLDFLLWLRFGGHKV